MKSAQHMIDKKRARRKAKLPYRLQGIAKGMKQKEKEEFLKKPIEERVAIVKAKLTLKPKETAPHPEMVAMDKRILAKGAQARVVKKSTKNKTK